MKNLFLPIICLIGFAVTLTAQQENPITLLPEGVYTSHYQIRYKNPSYPIDYVYQKQGREFLPLQELQVFNGNEFQLKKLFFVDLLEQKQRIKTQDIWAIVTNDRVFVNYGNFFYQLGVVGSISAFQTSIDPSDRYPYSTVRDRLNSSPVNDEWEARRYGVDPAIGLANIQNGEVGLMNYFLLEDWLQSGDYRLYRKLKLEQPSYQSLLAYVVSYNKRNAFPFRPLYAFHEAPKTEWERSITALFNDMAFVKY